MIKLYKLEGLIAMRVLHEVDIWETFYMTPTLMLSYWGSPMFIVKRRIQGIVIQEIHRGFSVQWCKMWKKRA
jgi:hypothetical protein